MWAGPAEPAAFPRLWVHERRTWSARACFSTQPHTFASLCCRPRRPQGRQGEQAGSSGLRAGSRPGSRPESARRGGAPAAAAAASRSCHHTMHICGSTETDACNDLSDAAEGILLAAERMRPALPKKLGATPRHKLCFQVFRFAKQMSNLPQAGLCPSVGVAEAEPASAGPPQESGSAAAATNRRSSRQQGEGEEYSANMTSKLYQHHVYMCKTAQ